MLKSLKYGMYTFTSGFALYSLGRYISSYQPSLTKEQFTKLLNKIRNLSIHLMMQRYDSNNKMKNQLKDDSEPEITDITSSQIGSSDPLIEQFNIESEQMILEIELEKARQVKLTIEQYNNYLTTYINDPSIRKIILTMKNGVESLQQQMIPKYAFGNIIPVKYFEIISNIFYFTLKKSTKKYYEEIELYPNDISYKERNTLFNKCYANNLKETRSEVVKFFNIESDQMDFSPKLSLRLYPFYYDKKHPFRLNYKAMNDEVNQFIVFILNNPNKIEEFINHQHKDAIASPVDKVIDFKHFLQNEQNSEYLLKKDNYEDKFD